MSPGLAIETGTERRAIRTILVVDDIPALANMLASALQRQGYDVLTACDGVDAMRAAEAHPDRIQLLLTDVQMPGMNGVDLWHTLKAKQPELRVIFMSGSVEISTTDGQPFVRKPFALPELIDVVKNAFENADADSMTTAR
jgi:CheY-like chemotaxis protein